MEAECRQRWYSNVHRRNHCSGFPGKRPEVRKEWIGDGTVADHYEGVIAETRVVIRVVKYVPNPTGVTPKDSPLCLIELPFERIYLRVKVD